MGAQINSMGTTDSEGPAWNKFWMSLDNDTESAVSDGTRHTGPPIRPHQPDSPVRGSRHASGMSTDRHDSSAILPTDSASHHGDSPPASVVMYQQHSNPLDAPFPFKFKAPSGRMHRCQVAASGGLIELLAAVVQKLGSEVQNVGGEPEFGPDGKLEKQGFAMSYVDNEGDIVSITSDRDLIDAIEMARSGGRDKVDLYVHDPDSPPVIATADPKSAVDTPTESIAHRRRRRHEEEDAEESSEEEEETVAHRKAKKNAVSRFPTTAPVPPEVIPGVPNELLLPGALVTLAVVIVGVFAMSRK